MKAKERWTDALIVAILVTLVLVITVVPVHADEPVVRAVLFYSTNCPHCHRVITEVVIPLTEQYGETLQIIAVNTSQTKGQELYLAAVEAFGIPPERRGVPTLIVDDVVLVGSLEIPELSPLWSPRAWRRAAWTGRPSLVWLRCWQEESQGL